MKTFTDLSVVVPGNTFCNNVFKEVGVGVDFWKIP